jgi:type II secretory pathway pseudopilin PulG
MKRNRRQSRRGFTTVDIMATVLIVGILSVLAVAALAKQVRSAKAVEVGGMMQSIRAAQEAWRSENMTYLNVSAQGSWYPVDPGVSGNGTQKRNFYFPSTTVNHIDNANWLRLSPKASGPVQFGYLVNAGLPGTAMRAPEFTIAGGFTWPTATEPWYVIQAKGDLDGDGEGSFHMMSSLNNELFSLNEGE